MKEAYGDALSEWHEAFPGLEWKHVGATAGAPRSTRELSTLSWAAREKRRKADALSSPACYDSDEGCHVNVDVDVDVDGTARPRLPHCRGRVVNGCRCPGPGALLVQRVSWGNPTPFPGALHHGSRASTKRVKPCQRGADKTSCFLRSKGHNSHRQQPPHFSTHPPNRSPASSRQHV